MMNPKKFFEQIVTNLNMRYNLTELLTKALFTNIFGGFLYFLEGITQLIKFN